MTRYETTEITVCTVCVHLIANGEYDDGTTAAEDCARGQVTTWGDDARHLFLGEGYDGFAHTPCEGCGDTLAGHRFPAVAMIPTTEGVTR